MTRRSGRMPKKCHRHQLAVQPASPANFLINDVRQCQTLKVYGEYPEDILFSQNLGVLNYCTNVAIAFRYDDVGRMAISHVAEVGVNTDRPQLQLRRVLHSRGNLSVYTTTLLGWT